jgi:hypothetical protein
MPELYVESRTLCRVLWYGEQPNDIARQLDFLYMKEYFSSFALTQQQWCTISNHHQKS